MNEFENITKQLIAKYEFSLRENSKLFKTLKERDKKLTKLYGDAVKNELATETLKNKLAVLESKYAQAMDFINDYELCDDFDVYIGAKEK